MQAMVAAGNQRVKMGSFKGDQGCWGRSLEQLALRFNLLGLVKDFLHPSAALTGGYESTQLYWMLDGQFQVW